MGKGGRQLTGAAGEFLVGGELSRHGWTTALTVGNAVRTDLFAEKDAGSKEIAVQVKTKRSGNFQVGVGAEQLPEAWGDVSFDDQWFVLVSLGGNEKRVKDRFFVIPRLHVACFVFVDYRVWLSSKGRNGQARNATLMRTIKPIEIEAYENRWDLLETPASEAPWMLREWWWERAEEYLDTELLGFEMPQRATSP